ncbi:soluble lytic murein transglycosylase [Epibacterium ulvae]|uniref:Soluble lytic murein transglycosylase n=1 Tax=Epibacterium ulvae TaxID=1156985 RepID=A0A1G5R6Q7_9RHOB|nr:lytic transglycosylase domain-containing protein [Epibacterium ulvae]SCZ69528.1 soluble lytic murein transglycosylase [Epibacterium ulvae]
MQVKTHALTLIATIFLVLYAPTALLARGLSEAMPLIRSENWSAAARAAGREGSIARDIVLWHQLRSGNGSAQEALAFLSRRHDWPGLALLRRRMEAQLSNTTAETVRAFFTTADPQTADGVLAYARALERSGARTKAETEIKRAWLDFAMREATQNIYLERYGKLLAPLHTQRLDSLLWQNHRVSAKRMLPLVSAADRAVAEARIGLQETINGVDGLINAVPAARQADPGLAYDRFVWRDGKRRQEDAIQLLLDQSTGAKALGNPASWLRRRRDFARQDLRDDNYERAYQLAAFHFATPDDGYGYADSEWIAGYVALRKLKDPELAVYHFDRFLGAVKSPISIGRGGYWLGQAYAALNDTDRAHAAFTMAAQYQTSFYGLLAAEALGRPFDPALRAPVQSTDWRNAPFMQSSVTQAALELLAVGELSLAERFLTHQVETLPVGQARQLGQMVVEMKQPHLAVMISKRAAQRGIELKGAYYPLHPVAQENLPMAKEMVLAIARRESEFDPSVSSHVGARGLMQLMPGTADLVAKDLGISDSHTTDRLISEWPYNARLGSQYLVDLAKTFDGNAVMMAAGYNAGPHRLPVWIERYGDPRDGIPDIVDWIEHIPFNETRNYVMRVAESLPVYRARLGKEPLPIPFSQELSGSTLKAFAP